MKSAFAITVLAAIFASPCYSSCVLPCFAGVETKLFQSGRYYLDISEDYVRKWKADENCPSRATGYKELAEAYLLQAWSNGPYSVPDPAKSVPLAKAMAQDPTCSLADITAIYADMRTSLTEAEKSFRAIKKLSEGAICDQLIASFNVFTDSYNSNYEVLRDLLAGCPVDGFETPVRRPTRGPCEPICNEYEIQKWLMGISTQHGERAVKRWAAVPSAGCDCCWTKIQTLNQAYADADTSVRLTRTAFGLATTTKSSLKKPANKAALPGCRDCVSYELISAGFPTLPATNCLVSQFIDTVNSCPSFGLRCTSYRPVLTQINALLDSVEMITVQIDEFYIPLLDSCPAR